MTDTEYLTAAEIAQRAGISRQTVYNRIKNEWQPYAKEIDGKTCVSVKALSSDPVQFDNDLTTGFDRNLTENCQTKCQIDTPDLSNPLSNEWTVLVSELKSALDDKKQEIDRLRADLAAERTRSADLERRLLEYADRFADMAEREQELTNNAQKLHALSEAREAAPELSPPGTKKEPSGIRGWFRRRAGKDPL